MKIFIINLQRSPERKAIMRERINQLELTQQKLSYFPIEFVFFNAIDASTGQHLQYAQYLNILRMKLYSAKELSPGEIGCYASHFALWQRCIAINEPVIIIEDDVVFNDNFFIGIARIAQSEYDYVRLIWSSSRDKNFIQLSDHFYFCWKKVRGTQGYYITPRAAKKLSSANYWTMPVDNYLDAGCLHGVKNILHRPPLLSDGDDGVSTMIRDNIKKPLFWKIFREINWIIIKIRMYYFKYKR